MSEQEKIHRQLSAYLDGELSGAERRRVEETVEKDDELAAELEQLRATRELVRTLPRDKAPEDLVSRILGQAERRHLMGTAPAFERGGSLRWVRYLAAAAVLLIAASVGVVVVTNLWFAPTFNDRIAEDESGDMKIAAAPKDTASEVRSLKKAKLADMDDEEMSDAYEEAVTEDVRKDTGGATVALAAKREADKSAAFGYEGKTASPIPGEETLRRPKAYGRPKGVPRGR